MPSELGKGQKIRLLELQNYGAVVVDGDLLDVRTIHAVGHAMGMANITACNGALSADFTNLGHLYQLHVLHFGYIIFAKARIY